ncbi:hypothetical protein LTR09_005561 [Extremus antarcticus]|uniref:N-acetyltransferase domain-containing protein n=1 Tax=Extremus antarcticus TaxID=702011 RepID=A0AAJ0DN58_9PEZI|nr:hypothetical protein LTR09_005561 [Extremus antarcticus]
MATDGASGAEVNFDQDCIFPPREKIVGDFVELFPLQEEHADDLYSIIGGEETSKLYDYMGYGPFLDHAAFYTHIEHYANTKDPQLYAILNSKTRKLVGHIAFLRIDVPNRVIEIGHVLFSPSLQRTREATETFYLMANKAFEYGYRRLEWKCDSNNAASRRAALRFGHTFEGVFRQHMIRKGRNRDSAWYSILDKEWRLRKSAFLSWLRSTKLDPSGKQIEGLKWYQEVHASDDSQYQ